MSATCGAVHVPCCRESFVNFEFNPVPGKANTPTALCATDAVRLDELARQFERTRLIYLTRNYNVIILTSRDSCH